MKHSPLPKFSETYLYRLHTLTNALDKAFDRTLRECADMTLSQFMLLITVAEHAPVGQRQAARLLELSAPAVNRQADIALKNGWLEMTDGQALKLTAAGEATVRKGLDMLEQRVLHIFTDSEHPAGLMEHIVRLSGHTKGVLEK